MSIKKFFKSKNIQAACIAAVVSLVVSIGGISINYCLIKKANNLSEEANIIANQSYNISKEIFNSKEIPRLTAFPTSAKFYTPDKPEVPGQVKISIGALIENLSEITARNVAINFETEDWYGHKTSLFNIYREAKMPIPHILSLPKNSRILYPSYAPDAPSGGEDEFAAQDKPFKLKITLYWNDINDKKYVYVGFYDLKHTTLPNHENQLYFQPIETYDNIKDGDIAWTYEKKK